MRYRRTYVLNNSYMYIFSSRFPFPPKIEGRRKGERIAKIVNKSHAFLLDHLMVGLF